MNVAPPSGVPGSTPLTPSDFQRGLAAGDFVPSCAQGTGEDVRCFAYVLTQSGRIEAQRRASLSAPRKPAATTASGYGPANLQSAYGTAGVASSGGSGRLVAIVDAYDDPNLESDLGVYRSHYGLPPCTTANGCFEKVGQTGTNTVPRKSASWSQEISLDVDMVSANCPNCHIVVVEANSASFSDLATAENTAASLGAVAISNSYGGSESSSVATYASAYSHSGIAITVSNGDAGYGVESPASYATVTAVGGTSLNTATNTRGWSETVWTGTGSGCSAYIAKPSWQTDPSCARRMVGDVSYVADPYTGVAVYDSYAYQGLSGWLVFGGTSVGAPAIAAIYGLAGTTLSTASNAYANTGALYDVTSGSNGTCTTTYFCNAVVGYDGPTGLGTPDGTTAF